MANCLVDLISPTKCRWSQVVFSPKQASSASIQSCGKTYSISLKDPNRFLQKRNQVLGFKTQSLHNRGCVSMELKTSKVLHAAKTAAVTGTTLVSSLIVGLMCNGLITLRDAYGKGMIEDIEQTFSGGGGNNGNTPTSGGDGGGEGGDNGSNSEKHQSMHCKDEADVTDGQLSVSIVVPVLNEEACIEETIRRLKELNPKPKNIIVVDGGSTDATLTLAEQCEVITVKSGRGRPVQMNKGAHFAIQGMNDGDGVLVFLHADTIVPQDLVQIVSNTLRDPQVVCGGFVPIVFVPGRVLWGMTMQNIVKTWYAPMFLRPLSFIKGLRCLFGDQVMFCRARDFSRVKGFDESLPIMEDANLCERLHMGGLADSTVGRILMVNRTVYTSGRRMVEWGPLKTTIAHYVIGLSYAFGASPQRLHELYKQLYNDVR